MKNKTGVFETIRTYHGQLFELSAHLRRLRASARALHIPIRATNTTLTALVRSSINKSGETRLKLTVTPEKITVAAGQLHISKKIYTQGVAACTFPGKRPNPAVKSTDRALEDTVYNKASKRNYFDGLLMNKNKTIPEASRSNVFYVKNNIIHTADKNILLGITRLVVLRLAKNKFTVHYCLPSLEDLYQADECFITRTSAGVVPVVRINRQAIANGKPGVVTRKLIELFNECTNR